MLLSNQPPASKQASFEVYRYQLVVDKMLQQGMFQDYQTADEIRNNKNKILQDILTNIHFRFHSSQSEITSKLLYSAGTMSYYKIGVRRKTKVYKIDFSEDVIENYPNIIVAINNDPNVQKVAIQVNQTAFQDSKIASHIVQKSITAKLKHSNLSFIIEPLFDEKEFWKLIEQYPKQIRQVNFDLISPNLAKISKNLKVDLKQLYNETNTQRTKIELNAEPESYLEIKKESEFVNSLVEYSADGGGNISLKVNGIRKKIQTAQSAKEFSVEEVLLKGNDWDKLNDMFKDILI